MASGKQNFTNNFGEQTQNYVKPQVIAGKTGTSEFIFASGAALFSGAGAPTITAPAGSMYLRTDGATNSEVLYVTFNGTTWAALVTA